MQYYVDLVRVKQYFEEGTAIVEAETPEAAIELAKAMVAKGEVEFHPDAGGVSEVANSLTATGISQPPA